ncbi:MAG: hypothetical protein AB4041_15535 [Microcystaceae cyanobacterium]
MNIYLNGQKIKLSPHKAIGKGGEADVFQLSDQQAVKVFKPPTHPDYQGLPLAQKAAEERLQEHQQKLRYFPQSLPTNVIKPQDLVTDKTGQKIVGYTMAFLANSLPLFKYSDRRFRLTSGIDNQTVIELFKQLHKNVNQLHQFKVIIGDFNDLNILISANKLYLIDADSYQYYSFLCRVFTPRFVDPLLCNPNENQLILQQTYNIFSDWYAFTVMLMQCLLFVEPYGGVYKPKNKQAKIPQSQRPLQRITIFNPEVKYPKPAIPYRVLGDDLLHYFHQCFTQDKRTIFPETLLNNLQWYKCPSCGVESNYTSCPICHQTIIKQVPKTSISSNLIVNTVFKTSGLIVEVYLENDQLKWLYHEDQSFKREDQSIILQGDLDPYLQFWLKNNLTFVGRQGKVIALQSQQVKSQLAVDSYDHQLMFRCNEVGRYWLYQGQLLKQGKLGAEYIGDILENQTQFWIGSHFGFGFYRAGNINTAFVFNLNHVGINDQVKLPNLLGKLIDAYCTFSQNYCWFFITLENQRQLINKVYVINQKGDVITMTEATLTDNLWLSTLRGKFALNHALLAATDEGIIRLEVQSDKIVQTKTFTETEPYVDQSSQLFASSQGIYVVNSKEINFMSYQS